MTSLTTDEFCALLRFRQLNQRNATPEACQTLMAEAADLIEHWKILSLVDLANENQRLKSELERFSADAANERAEREHWQQERDSAIGHVAEINSRLVFIQSPSALCALLGCKLDQAHAHGVLDGPPGIAVDSQTDVGVPQPREALSGGFMECNVGEKIMTKVTNEMVDRFLAWPFPASVCSDRCVTDSNYPHPRFGTNLLTATEAREMLEHVLEGSGGTK